MGWLRCGVLIPPPPPATIAPPSITTPPAVDTGVTAAAGGGAGAFVCQCVEAVDGETQNRKQRQTEIAVANQAMEQT
eukprot:630257-Rhodomonas_salina.2